MLVTGALIGAYLAWAFAALSYFSMVAPQAAPAQLATYGVVKVELVNRLMGSSIRSRDVVADYGPAAISALRVRPLDPIAVRLLGGEVDIANSRIPGSEVLNLSERLSRRDHWTQLFLVLTKTANGNLDAMDNIDKLLTVRPSMVGQVMPPMLELARSDAGRTLLRARSEREWFSLFVRGATTATEHPTDLAQLVLGLGPTSTNLGVEDFGRLAGQLASAGDFSRAVAVAEAGGLDQSALEEFSPEIKNSDSRFTPLTWSFENAVDGVVALDEPGLRLEARAGGQFVAMVRVTALSAGSYTLGYSIGTVSGKSGLTSWEMRCRAEGGWTTQWRPGWTETVPGASSFDIEIPADCAVQYWELRVQGPEGQGVTSLNFDVDLSPETP